MGKETKEGLGEAMRRIREILSWFDEREEVDVEEGLKKVKEGAELIAKSKERLVELENEFAEVKAKLDLNDE
jgi:hypothetical protein